MVRSERACCEGLEDNLLFRGFLGMRRIEPSFDPTTFTDNWNGRLVDFRVTQVTGRAERDIVPELIEQAQARQFRPRMLGAVLGDRLEAVDHRRRRDQQPGHAE